MHEVDHAIMQNQRCMRATKHAQDDVHANSYLCNALHN